MIKSTMATKPKPIEISIRRVCVGNKKLVCRTVPHGLNSKMHWAKKHEWDNAWKAQVFWLIREKGWIVRQMEYARIEIELKSVQPQDKDNAYGSVKPLVDATKGFVIEDDNQDQLDLIVRSVRVNRRSDEGVKIRITELDSKWKEASEIL